MTETFIHLTQPGTLALPPQTVLRCDEARDLLAHTGEMLRCRAQAGEGARYMVMLPLTAEAEHQLTRASQTLRHLRLQTEGVPPVALGQIETTGRTALIMPLYETRLATVVQGQIESGQWLAAERQAVQSAIAYTYILDALRTLETPRACISQTLGDFYWHEDGLIVTNWETLVEATRESHASEISLWGQIWHALVLNRYGTPPLYPYNDEFWSLTHGTAEGIITLGLRAILSSAISASPERRFVDREGIAQPGVLRRLLQTWDEALKRTPEMIESQDLWSLYGFAESLPLPTTRVQINAIWEDLRWRVARASGNTDESLQSARQMAVSAARQDVIEQPAYRERESRFTATGEYPVVVDEITSPERLKAFKEAVREGSYSSADWMYHHILRDAANDVERRWIGHELDPYVRYMRFMQRYDDPTVLTTTPTPTVLMAADGVLNEARIEDKSSLYRVIVQCATIAYIRLEQAVELKTWPAIQQGQGAYRAFQSASWERALIDRVRPLYTDEMRFPNLDSLVEQYGRMHQLYQKLFQASKADIWLRADATSPLTRQHAFELLTLLQSAQSAGLELDDVIDNDETSRQRWQVMIESALSTLKQVDLVRDEMEDLRTGLTRIDTVAGDVNALKTQVQGRDNVGGLVQQIRDLERRLIEWTEAPGDTRAKLTTDLGDLKQRFVSIERDVREGWSSITRVSGEKMPRVERLLDDVRARFDTIEGELRRRAVQEGQTLMTFIESVNKDNDLKTSQDVLDHVDSLLYALHRCPTEAYTPSVHEAWHTAFKRLETMYLESSHEEGRRLWRNQKSRFEINRSARIKDLEACEREAVQKLDSYKMIKSTLAGK
jgi:hypothetical protein